MTEPRPLITIEIPDNLTEDETTQLLAHELEENQRRLTQLSKADFRITELHASLMCYRVACIALTVIAIFAIWGI